MRNRSKCASHILVRAGMSSGESERNSLGFGETRSMRNVSKDEETFEVSTLAILLMFFVY